MAPWIIPAAAAAIGAISGAAKAKASSQQNKANVAAASAAGQNQYNQNKAAYGLAIPQNERQRALDPARNAVLSAIVGRQFAGRVDPTTVTSLRDAGARPALDAYPEYVSGAAAYNENAPGMPSQILAGLGEDVAAPALNAWMGQQGMSQAAESNNFLQQILDQLQPRPSLMDKTGVAPGMPRRDDDN